MQQFKVLQLWRVAKTRRCRPWRLRRVQRLQLSMGMMMALAPRRHRPILQRQWLALRCAGARLIALFMIYPIVWSLWMSFQSGRGMMLKFAGFANIVRLWNDPVFIKALTNTLTYFVVQVPIMILLALILASLLNNPRLVGRGFFRTAIFLPCVTSLVAYSVLFKACSRSTASSTRRLRRSASSPRRSRG